MRLHIELDDRLVADLDALAGPRGRSAFVRTAIERALEHARRWDDLSSAAGTLAESPHEWGDDPAAWVREQRRADPRRAG